MQVQTNSPEGNIRGVADLVEVIMSIHVQVRSTAILSEATPYRVLDQGRHSEPL
jgi:hypothetical protein